jgi:hypothetical protein
LAANTDLGELKKGEHVEPEAVAKLEDRIKAGVPSFVFSYGLSISDGPVGVRGHVINAQILLFHHPHKCILVVHDNSSTIGVFFLRGISLAFASNCSEERRICTSGGSWGREYGKRLLSGIKILITDRVMNGMRGGV